jgi:hypothetical protein
MFVQPVPLKWSSVPLTPVAKKLSPAHAIWSCEENSQ